MFCRHLWPLQNASPFRSKSSETCNAWSFWEPWHWHFCPTVPLLRVVLANWAMEFGNPWLLVWGVSQGKHAGRGSLSTRFKWFSKQSGFPMPRICGSIKHCLIGSSCSEDFKATSAGWIWLPTLWLCHQGKMMAVGMPNTTGSTGMRTPWIFSRLLGAWCLTMAASCDFQAFRCLPNLDYRDRFLFEMFDAILYGD